MSIPASGRLLSTRASRMRMSFSLTYETEDVIASLLNLQVHTRSVPDSGLRRRVWLGTRLPHLMGPRQTAGHAGLVLAVGQTPQALLDHLGDLPAISGAVSKVAIIEELWRHQLPLHGHALRFLSRFDHLFLGSAGSCEPLAELIDRPVGYLPHAVDAGRFLRVGQPERSIDVYAMGRRNPDHHEILRAWARREGRLYLYDTFTRNPCVRSYDEHRDNLVGLIGRSRVFMVNEAKVGQAAREHVQSEVGYRYFEGTMGGAVLVGQRPSTPVFDELFPWPGAVIAAAPDGSDLEGIITGLVEDPSRHARLSLRNRTGSLRRHDIAHRVRSLLATIGVPEPESVATRIQSLEIQTAALEAATHPSTEQGTPHDQLRRHTRP